MKIQILCNHVGGGWCPDAKMLGGSEECVKNLAQTLAKNNFEVTIFLNQTEDDNKNVDYTYKSVKYRNRGNFYIDSEAILITFKENSVYKNHINNIKCIHWSSEIENFWNTENIEYFVNLTEFHDFRNIFVPYDKRKIIPHGIDYKSLDRNKCGKEKNTLLYCSSPDRGLYQLLKDWPQIKEFFPNLKLNITYGFELFDNVTGGTINHFKYLINDLCEQKDVNFLGTLSKDETEKQYWKNEYWILPLNNPDSELFCLNALKSRYCNCKPIVNKLGALKETVGDYIRYEDLKKGNMKINSEKPKVEVETWQGVFNKYWSKILKG